VLHLVDDGLLDVFGVVPVGQVQCLSSNKSACRHQLI